MEIRSIYTDHYEGTTYRTGVAYLRARSQSDDRAPEGVGVLNLDAQRADIIEFAKGNQMIIVAEFIEHGTDHPHGTRPALDRLLKFAEATHPGSCIVAGLEYMATDHEAGLLKFRFDLASMNVYSASA